MTNEQLQANYDSNVAELASDFDEDDSPFMVSGVAIGEDEVTHGAHGAKFWPAHELRKAADSLSGVPLTKNHNSRDVEAVVGQVMRAAYRDGIGVVYEAEIDDPELAQKVDRGRLDVSIHAVHADGGEDDEGRMIAEDIEFVDLSLVPIGAAESNEVDTGESDAMASAMLSAAEIGDELDDAGAEIEDELAQVHEPSYSGTDSERDWDGLDLEDFGEESWDDLSMERKSEIAGHFMVSDTTFPPAEFGALGFEVVFPDGDLSLAGLRAAKSRAPQSDLPQDQVVRVQRLATRLANREYDAGWDMNGNAGGVEDESSMGDDTQNEESESSTTGSEAASTNEDESNMTQEENTDTPEQPSRAELAERVEELEAENEDLRSEVEEVRMEYAEHLADGTILEADELADRFEFSELKQKFEDADEDLVESEASDPVVEAGGAESDATGDNGEDELTETEELEQRLSAYEERGLGDSAAARKIRGQLD